MKTINIKGYIASKFKSQHVALLSKKEDHFKILHEFARCRGWMSDQLYRTIIGATSQVYDKGDFNLTSGFIYIGVSFESVEMKTLFLSNLNSLHSKEQLAKIKKTKLYATQDPLVLVAEGSRHWKNCLWKMQLYTYYLRSMCYKDLIYYPETHKKLNHNNNELVLLSKLKDKHEEYKVESIHGHTGPDAICQGSDNKYMTNYLGITPCQ